MSISVPTEPVYMPCYHVDCSTRSISPGTYNYTETLQRMAEGTENTARTYWEPDEYGRVWIDPDHLSYGTLEPSVPADCSEVQLPAPGSASLPAGPSGEAEEKQRAKKEEERKAQEEQLRLFREDRERLARQEALLHRLSMAILSTKC